MNTLPLTNAALTIIALSPSLTFKSPLNPDLPMKEIWMELEEVTNLLYKGAIKIKNQFSDRAARRSTT